MFQNVRHLGKFDPTFKPFQKGGLTEKDIERLQNNGWSLKRLSEDIPQFPVVFKDDEAPCGIEIYTVDLPKGLEVLHNEDKKQTVIKGCSNTMPTPDGMII